MSIFVLNLATLLGFGLGVDYALLLSSRFREELGRATSAGHWTRRRIERRVEEARRRDRRDRRSSGLLQRRDRAAGPDRPDALRVHGPALGRHRRRDRRGTRSGRRPDAAARPSSPILGPRIDSFPICRSDGAGKPQRRRSAGRQTPTAGGFWWRLANRVMDHPVAVFVPTLGLPDRARAALPARALQRTRRHDPAQQRAVASGLRRPGQRVPGRRLRAAAPRGPDRWSRHRPGERRAPLRLLATARRRPARPARGQHRGHRSAPPPRAVPADLRRTPPARAIGTSRTRWRGRRVAT